MGSQPIRIQLGKILWENLAGNVCGKCLQELFVGNSCGKFLWENLVGQGEGEKANLRKAVTGGNLPFGIG